jgi:hypothetical protein
VADNIFKRKGKLYRKITAEQAYDLRAAGADGILYFGQQSGIWYNSDVLRCYAPEQVDRETFLRVNEGNTYAVEVQHEED